MTGREIGERWRLHSNIVMTSLAIDPFLPSVRSEPLGAGPPYGFPFRGKNYLTACIYDLHYFDRARNDSGSVIKLQS